MSPDVVPAGHSDEPHTGAMSGRLNWLRAGVLGANDGIVSTAGIVMGVAGATSERTPVLVAGIAGLVAGALSMGAGEYVSVSTQRDSERSMLALEAEELEKMPETELRELAKIYQRKGLSRDLARRVAEELTAHDALAAHAEAEFGIDKDNLTKPWNAALASMVAFTVGALLPLLVITLSPHEVRIWATVVAVAIALAIAGVISARLGYSPWGRAVLRNVGGGLVAMGITYAVGSVVGTHV
ncbi:MAG TPA: VIT family protein [Nocardioides sp.]|nr:VIT family protein [Nocardioides sp.]